MLHARNTGGRCREDASCAPGEAETRSAVQRAVVGIRVSRPPESAAGNGGRHGGRVEGCVRGKEDGRCVPRREWSSCCTCSSGVARCIGSSAFGRLIPSGRSRGRLLGSASCDKLSPPPGEASGESEEYELQASSSLNERSNASAVPLISSSCRQGSGLAWGRASRRLVRIDEGGRGVSIDGVLPRLWIRLCEEIGE